MRRTLALCFAIACGGKTAAPAAAPEPAAAETEANCDDDMTGSEWPCGVEPDDVDCFEGPGANVFEAEAGGDPPGLWINACHWDDAGPAQVIAVDARVLDATAQIDSELDASYDIDAPGFTASMDDEVAAIVVLPAVPDLRLVSLTEDDLAAIGELIRHSTATTVLAIDVDDDGHGDAAIVHADGSDWFVKRVDAGWTTPYQIVDR